MEMSHRILRGQKGELVRFYGYSSKKCNKFSAYFFIPWEGSQKQLTEQYGVLDFYMMPQEIQCCDR